MGIEIQESNRLTELRRAQHKTIKGTVAVFSTSKALKQAKIYDSLDAATQTRIRNITLPILQKFASDLLAKYEDFLARTYIPAALAEGETKQTITQGLEEAGFKDFERSLKANEDALTEQLAKIGEINKTLEEELAQEEQKKKEALERIEKATEALALK